MTNRTDLSVLTIKQMTQLIYIIRDSYRKTVVPYNFFYNFNVVNYRVVIEKTM